ncbi:putative type IX secretion system sortase PorU2 [Limnovirga soli]|uniref:T9SS type A sorting domain-containing protein n=1 Tax=Limnovirga soli TaxID=2656915 RepID=A0A8J8FE13_9BACT|nr:C25 family cysteine peptidase [Limnovirga soli]NNV56351.1 T9SS type A sorting domain-containing protein [Limnovirga soli]
MKQLFFVLLLTITAFTTRAQHFNNEWIDYGKTYYKFKVGPFGLDITASPIKKGVVRITQPTLAASGLGNIDAENFQLLREGKEVPLYISKPSGILTSADYIEFWGEIANGKVDKALYRDSALQLSDYWNLETDSATYFLTVNAGIANKRFVNTINNIAGVSIAPDKNFTYTIGRYFKGSLNEGYGIFVEQRLYSSSYDKGEGYMSRPIRRNGSPLGNVQLPQTFFPLQLDTTGPLMTARFTLMGNSPYDREVKILMNGDSLTQFPMGYFNSAKLTIDTLSPKRLKRDSVTFMIQNITDVNEDEMKIVVLELQYSRLFNFGNASSFEFTLPASDTGRYIKITKFNRGSSDAALYDITNGKRYIANTAITDTLQFFLEPSASDYQLVLVKADGSTAKTISSLQPRQMVNYADAANQGNYLIISNPLLYGSGNSNYLQQYSDYRSSDSGGHFNTRIIDIEQLEDQFAYGIIKHPLSVKNFLQYARTNFAVPPAYVFLVGKGISYTAYRAAGTVASVVTQTNLVPVFGSPGSDNLLSSANYDPTPATPIGRLSVINPDEIGAYLAKIKTYEAAQRDTTQTLANKAWMKKVIQLAGANDPLIGVTIDNAMRNYGKTITDTLFGANLINYSKTADPTGYPKAVIDFTNEYNDGSGLVEYFGHSSASNIDFSLDNPANYTNTGKYPLFIVNGCLAGNIFGYESNRQTLRSTLSEKFVLEPGKGAIGYLSSSSYGVVDYLDIFTQQFYNSIATTQYGKAFGQVTKEAIAKSLQVTTLDDFYGRMHAEQYTFNGDPALVLNSFAKPDYIIDAARISSTPGYLTTANDSFTVHIPVYNLGIAKNDSVHFSLERKFPNGVSVTAYSKMLPAIKQADTLVITLPIVGNRDKGTTTLTALIDDTKTFAELSENNNTASISVKISAADLLPVSPYNFSIVNTDVVNLAASTAYAFDSLTQYVMELDTTVLFNSPVKQTAQTVSTGGLIGFNNIALGLNNTVYFWRVSEDSADKHWNTFSFTHSNPGNSGFQQSHFYQHTESAFNGLAADTATRSFTFSPSFSNLFVLHSIFPTSGLENGQFSIAVNGSIITWSACVGSSIIFNVFDPLTFKPILNTTSPYNAGAICDSMRRYNFEYSTQTAATRKNAMDFMDNYVKNGYYVVVRKIYDQGNSDWAPTVWAKDTALYGSRNSLYHRLKDQGTQIDSFTYARTFIFVYKKNDAAGFKTLSVLSKGLYDRISLSNNMAIHDTVGTITSPKFGPSKKWNKVTWNGSASNANAISRLDIITIDTAGKDSLWYTIDTATHSFDITAIDAAQYPYVQLKMHTQDSVTLLPYQLQQWSVEFEPVPEGAIATNLGSILPDTLSFNHGTNITYDSLKGDVVFKNISSSNFDSLSVKLILYNQNNQALPFIIPKVKPLPAGDTVHIAFNINVTALPAGVYNLYLEVNPNNDQPEQYHYNNFLYHYVAIDRLGALPVQLINFTAKPVGKTVQLQWLVTQEQGVANYTVENSTNGTSFTPIAVIKASTLNSNQKQYGYTHTQPVNGNNFYRIKITDVDGKIAYSPIKNIPFSFAGIQLYPNPVKDLLHMVAAGNTTISWQLFDVAGRLLLHQSFNGSTTVNVNKLGPGIYVLQINNGTQKTTYKIVKQ